MSGKFVEIALQRAQQTEYLKRRLVDAEAENQQLRDALERRDSILSDWFAHYPEAVFLPLSPEQIAKAVDAITETGITSDALHAAWARHLLSTIMAKIKESDAALAAVRVEER
jgi:hypothetical protein